MGQGRKKCSQSGNYRYRRRSVAIDVVEQETATVMNYLGMSASRRHGSFSLCRTKKEKLESPPVQSIFKPCRHDSLVEYMSTSSSVNMLPTKKASIGNDSPANQYQTTDSLPLISTLPVVSTSPSTGCLPVPGGGLSLASRVDCEQGIDLLIDSIFPNSTVSMNGMGRDLTNELRAEMVSILSDVVNANHIAIDVSLFSQSSTSVSPLLA